MVNTSAIWQQAADTAYQPSSSNCWTAIQKSLYLKNKTTTTNLENFLVKSQENGPLDGKKKKTTTKKTREKEQQGLVEEQVRR